MPEHVLRIAEQAAMLGGSSAGLLVITAAWTGCRWGELAGLQRDHVDLTRGVIVIDPEFGALHESAHGLWLGPPNTPASARTITWPPFLTGLLREHLATTPGVFIVDCGGPDGIMSATFTWTIAPEIEAPMAGPAASALHGAAALAVLGGFTVLRRRRRVS